MLTGIDAANLCRIEQGKQSAGIDVLSKIANAMGYKIDFVEKDYNLDATGLIFYGNLDNDIKKDLSEEIKKGAFL